MRDAFLVPRLGRKVPQNKILGKQFKEPNHEGRPTQHHEGWAPPNTSFGILVIHYNLSATGGAFCGGGSAPRGGAFKYFTSNINIRALLDPQKRGN